MATQRRSLAKIILRVLAVLLLSIVLAAAGYVGYLSATYYRIDDNVELEVTSAATANKAQLEHSVSYTVATYNIGFGAYDPSFSFFMEEGWMADGTPTRGDELPEGLSVVRADNLAEVASCRGSDMPYVPGVTYLVTVDGFIVSDNVTATAHNVDAGFAYSDHNPVTLTFELGA